MTSGHTFHSTSLDTCVSSTYSYPSVFRSLSLAIALQMKELYVALHTIG